MKRKLLIGCAGAVGLMVLLGAVTFFSLRAWFYAVAEPIEGRALAGPETRFVLLYRGAPEDERAVSLVRFIAERMEAEGKVDEGMLSLVQRLGYATFTDWAADMLPITTGLLIDQQRTPVWFVSLSRFANPIMRFVRGDLERLGKRIGTSEPRIYHKGDVYVSVVGNTQVVSRSLESLKRALGRLEAGKSERAPVLARLGDKAPLRAALVDDGQFLDKLLAEQNDEQGRSMKDNLERRLDLGAHQFEWVSWQATVGLEKLDGTLILGLSDKASPKRIRDSVDRLLLEFVRHFLREELRFTHRARLDGKQVTVPFELGGLRAYWRKQIDK